MRRIRFKVWHLMWLVAVTASLYWVVLRWDSDTAISQAIGHTKVRLDFYVCEADPGRAVEGAAIRLVDLDFANDPREPYVLEIKTGPGGRASKVLDLRFSESRGVPSGRLHSFRVEYPQWHMEVKAAGYQGFAVPFQEYEMRDRRFHDARPAPPVVCQLRRLPR